VREKRFKGPLPKLVLLAGGLILGLFLAEGTLRVAQPLAPMFMGEMFWLSGEGFQRGFTIDPEMGFRPHVGRLGIDVHGTQPNAYAIEKRSGVERLLFIGDSVTNRAKIVSALRERYGDESYEYWNAGVESFNAVQVAHYYRKFNFGIHPDHVIFSLHNNDFQGTPVVFRDGERLKFYQPTRPVKQIDEWWYRHCHLYRSWVGFGSAILEPSDALVAEADQALGELAALLEEQGVRFSVILLPSFTARDEWKPGELKSREHALRILKKHAIRYIDLIEPLDAAVADGATLRSSPDDRWHPADDVAAYFADHLQRRQLF